MVCNEAMLSFKGSSKASYEKSLLHIFLILQVNQ